MLSLPSRYPVFTSGRISFGWWTMDFFSRQSALNVWNVNPKSVTYLTSTCQTASVRMQMQLQSASLKHMQLGCKSHFWVHHSASWQASASLIKQSIVLEAPFFQRLFRWIGSPFLSHKGKFSCRLRRFLQMNGIGFKGIDENCTCCKLKLGSS